MFWPSPRVSPTVGNRGTSKPDGSGVEKVVNWPYATHTTATLQIASASAPYTVHHAGTTYVANTVCIHRQPLNFGIPKDFSLFSDDIINIARTSASRKERARRPPQNRASSRRKWCHRPTLLHPLAQSHYAPASTSAGLCSPLVLWPTPLHLCRQSKPFSRARIRAGVRQ